MRQESAFERVIGVLIDGSIIVLCIGIGAMAGYSIIVWIVRTIVASLS